MDDTRKQETLKEIFFNAINMTKEERDFCLEILESCKDIADSDYKIGNVGKCEIVEMHFKKENDIIHANGILVIGNKINQEYRRLGANIYITKDNIIVDMLITRLMYEGENKEYRVFDEFILEDNKLKRRSFYNYDMESNYNDLDNEKVKGRLI